jgi:hypothetical protein
MFFGGWLYPDAFSAGLAITGVALNNKEFDCALTGINVAEPTNAPARRTLNTFRNDITFLASISSKVRIDSTIIVSLATFQGFELSFHTVIATADNPDIIVELIAFRFE